MCNDSWPALCAEWITKCEASTTRLRMHWLLAWARFGCHSRSPPSMILRSIKWMFSWLSWELTWTKRSICTHRRDILCLLQSNSRFTDPWLRETWWKIVLRLTKSLDSLMQSLHISYWILKVFVFSIGFVASRVDGGLSVLEHERTVIAAVMLYVDNLRIIANLGLRGQTKDQRKERFRIHDLGSVSFVFRLTIRHKLDHQAIDIYLHTYIQTILAMFRMDESRLVAKPMAMMLDERKHDEDAYDPTIYQAMIRMLMYVMIATWPDTAYAIRVLHRYGHAPSNEYMVALNHLFWYLNATKYLHLRVTGALPAALGGGLRGETEGAHRYYVGLDYAGCPDAYKSTSGLVNIFRGAVDWRSMNQKVTAQFTNDAEYYAFGVGCMRPSQISHLLNELSIPTTHIVFSDSQSLIVSVRNRIYRGTGVALIATK